MRIVKTMLRVFSVFLCSGVVGLGIGFLQGELLYRSEIRTANDYVSLANPSTLNFGTSDFTIAAWVKRQATGAEHNILSKTASGAWVSGGKEFFISGSDNTLAFGSFGSARFIPRAPSPTMVCSTM